ncbi:MAG: hypothetical protein JNK73_03985 [Bacteroidia bacterium]|nr:hypothetical protein [Bacteroidia bacterium]
MYSSGATHKSYSESEEETQQPLTANWRHRDERLLFRKQALLIKVARFADGTLWRACVRYFSSRTNFISLTSGQLSVRRRAPVGQTLGASRTQTMTHFSISNGRYYMLTSASIYLIFHYLTLSLDWTRKNFEFILSNDFNFMNVLLILSSCVVFLTFISYFSFYDLRLLKGLSICIVFLELIYLTIPSLLGLPDIANDILAAATNVLYIIWVFLVLRLDRTKFPAAKSFKLFAKMWLLALILTATFTFLMGWTDFPALFAPHYFFLTLPYFALLKLAGRLRNRTELQPAST